MTIPVQLFGQDPATYSAIMEMLGLLTLMATSTTA